MPVPDTSNATLVLDFGKTHTRGCVVDARGSIVAIRKCDTPVVRTGIYPHIDTDSLATWLFSTLSDLAAQHAITAIVPVAHGACAALIAGDQLVLPVLDYEWPGVNEIDHRYLSIRPSFSETRSPALPNGLNLGRQLYWLQSRHPDSFDAAEAILCYPQYWSWLLTGRRSTEVSSLGCHSDLWDPENRRLSSLVDDAGWRDKFPPIESAWNTAGHVRPDIIDRTGLNPNCRVKTGVHDSNASYLRHLRAHAKPFTVISTGTWIVLMTAGGDPAVLDESRDMLANVDVFGDPVASARFMGGREYAAIAGKDGLDATVEPGHIADLIDRGKMALPSFVESCGPFANRTGEIVGPAPESVAERAALATLYCALMCDVSLSLLDVRRGPLIIEGSFAGNRAFCGVLAQLRGQPVHVSDDDTGTVVGATLLIHDLARHDTQPERPDTTTIVEPTALPELENYKARWVSLLGAVDIGDDAGWVGQDD